MLFGTDNIFLHCSAPPVSLNVLSYSIKLKVMNSIPIIQIRNLEPTNVPARPAGSSNQCTGSGGFHNYSAFWTWILNSFDPDHYSF
jgi:hypothetical protein